jgi:hypothetical protein
LRGRGVDVRSFAAWDTGWRCGVGKAAILEWHGHVLSVMDVFIVNQDVVRDGIDLRACS